MLNFFSNSVNLRLSYTYKAKIVKETGKVSSPRDIATKFESHIDNIIKYLRNSSPRKQWWIVEFWRECECTWFAHNQWNCTH